MNLRDRLAEYVRAAFSGIWIVSHEHQDALLEIAQLCRDEQWQLASWDLDAGLSMPGQSESDTAGSDPLAAIRSLHSLTRPEGTAILVLENFHRFMQSAEIVQALSRQIVNGKQSRAIIVILAPSCRFPRSWRS